MKDKNSTHARRRSRGAGLVGALLATLALSLLAPGALAAPQPAQWGLPVEEGPEGGPITEPPPFSVGVDLVTRRRLWLDFDAAAKATVRIQRAVGRNRWRLVRGLHAEAQGPERVKLAYPTLRPGLFRFVIRPLVPEAKRIVLLFHPGLEPQTH